MRRFVVQEDGRTVADLRVAYYVIGPKVSGLYAERRYCHAMQDYLRGRLYLRGKGIVHEGLDWYIYSTEQRRWI